jgi:hypothetical protein
MCLSIAIARPDDVLGQGIHLGFEWMIVHNRIGYRCGYVRLPINHPWHGRDYDDVPADVHGGLTFAAADVPCPKGGEDNAWWIGFDCAHCDDAPDPALPHLAGRLWSPPDAVVRTQEYVQAECERLCEQAQAAEPGPLDKPVEDQP